MTTKFWSPSRLILRMVSWKVPPPSNQFSSSSGSQLVTNKPAVSIDGCSCLCKVYHQQHYQQIRGFRTSSTINNLEEDELANRGDKVMRVRLSSTRVDAVLKAGLSMSRNKIEKAFYDDRIRVNGERASKKSQEIFEGDEVDVIRGYNNLNPENFLDVSRVELVEIGNEKRGQDDDDDEDSSDDEAQTKMRVVLRRSKLLTIKNYQRPWKGQSSSD